MNNKISSGPVLITGGAGFIGANLTDRLLNRGHTVVILDDLSRSGSSINLAWLRSSHRRGLRIQLADIRDPHAVREAARDASFVFHLAAQVAVTSSLEDPIEDFDVNVRGTLNILEALRRQEHRPGLLYTSTNKVYGGLHNIPLHASASRYQPEDSHIARRGVGENQQLCFESPYGCSKGTADQYVLEYARSFNIPAVVFRMSCIYGPHQNGTADQGWVAHFLRRALQDRELTIYGDGRQVRDLLFVDDLIDAMSLAQENIYELSGEAFNIGGGPANSTSLIELLRLIRTISSSVPPVSYEDWRCGDQRYYVTDTSKFTASTGWKPHVAMDDGLRRLYHWLTETEPVPLAAAVAAGNVS